MEEEKHRQSGIKRNFSAGGSASSCWLDQYRLRVRGAAKAAALAEKQRGNSSIVASALRGDRRVAGNAISEIFLRHQSGGISAA
jgi:hypothetical protein